MADGAWCICRMLLCSGKSGQSGRPSEKIFQTLEAETVIVVLKWKKASGECRTSAETGKCKRMAEELQLEADAEMLAENRAKRRGTDPLYGLFTITAFGFPVGTGCKQPVQRIVPAVSSGSASISASASD